jgi:hypothetical protein
MSCENLSRLQYHRRVVRVELLIDVECAFDSSGGNDQFDGADRGGYTAQNLYGHAKDAARETTDAAVSYAKDAYENSGDIFRDRI